MKQSYRNLLISCVLLFMPTLSEMKKIVLVLEELKQVENWDKSHQRYHSFNTALSLRCSLFHHSFFGKLLQFRFILSFRKKSLKIEDFITKRCKGFQKMTIAKEKYLNFLVKI